MYAIKRGSINGYAAVAEVFSLASWTGHPSGPAPCSGRRSRDTRWLSALCWGQERRQGGGVEGLRTAVRSTGPLGLYAAYALLGAAALWCYLIGLTYAAKQETLGRVESTWPLAFLAAPVACGLWLASAHPEVLPFWSAFTVPGDAAWAPVAVAGFLLTLALQRYVPGT